MPATELVNLQWRQTTNSHFAPTKKTLTLFILFICIKIIVVVGKISSYTSSNVNLFFYLTCWSTDENIQSTSATIHVQTQKSCVNAVTSLYLMISLKQKLWLINRHKHLLVKVTGAGPGSSIALPVKSKGAGQKELMYIDLLISTNDWFYLTRSDCK